MSLSQDNMARPKDATIEPGVMPTYARADEVFVSGDGAILRDAKGRSFLDFLSGIAVNALGHSHPRMTAALRDQVGKVVHLSNLFRHPMTESVAARLCQHTGMAAAFFTNSGTESVECAMKLARKAMHLAGTPERTAFAALHGGFHGRSLGALSLTHKASHRAPFAPLLEVHWTPPNNTEALADLLNEHRPAALFMEPIQGEGGIGELSREFLQAARSLCTETKTVLVHDEIQSGCGRTGKFLAAQHHNVTPDVVTIAKPIGAGLPMGACLASEAYKDTLQQGDHGSTFGGGPLACRAASVFLDEIDEGLLEEVIARGHQLKAGLMKMLGELHAITEVRGRGLMLGIRLDRPAASAQSALHAEGLLVNCTATDVLRIVPPFVITARQVDDGLDRIHKVLSALPRADSPAS